VKVGEIVECSVGDEDRVSWLSAPAHDSDGRQEMVSPLFNDIQWNRVGSAVSYDTSC